MRYQVYRFKDSLGVIWDSKQKEAVADFFYPDSNSFREYGLTFQINSSLTLWFNSEVTEDEPDKILIGELNKVTEQKLVELLVLVCL